MAVDMKLGSDGHSHEEFTTVVPWLRKMFDQQGEVVALKETEGESMTYSELGRRVRTLSRHLRQDLGVMEGQFIGVCMNRSSDYIIAILGVLDAGAGYVPMDPDLPQRRLAYMVKEAQLPIILTQRTYALDLEDLSKANSCVLTCMEEMNLKDAALQDHQVDSNDVEEQVFAVPEGVANVIYTSGSSGEPKGVLVMHRSLVALAREAIQIWGVTRNSRVLQFSSHSFDASTGEIFAALCGGGTLVIGSREEMIPGRQLGEFLQRHRISSFLMPPCVLATLTAFRDKLPDVRTIIAAGESCPLAMARQWASPNRRFINGYGPTEATVLSNVYVFEGDLPVSVKSCPLGEPLPGWDVQLLDHHLQPVEDGCEGEIYIGGVGLAKGYLNKPGLTQKHFIRDPTTGKLWYRSGDVGIRRGAAGSRQFLEFAGRVDDQIKIHGFRVEIGAIENTLSEHPAVEHAAVKAVEVSASNDGNRMLVGYVVLRPHAVGQVSSNALQYFLLDRLPSYMVPSLYLFMESLPMTANLGKVDRGALPNLSVFNCTAAPVATIAPATLELDVHPFTSRCCRTFERALNLSHGIVKRNSNFFFLGGNSLCVARLSAELSEEFNVTVLPWQVYKHLTPEGLAKVVDRLRKETTVDLTFAWDAVQDVAKDSLLKEAHSLDESLQVSIPDDSMSRPLVERERSRPTGALVTGATGFLGVFLTERLLANGCFKVLYCIVRGESDALAWKRLQARREKYGCDKSGASSSTELVVLAGDLQHPNLGLSENSYSQLCTDVGIIYHAAADTNYIRPYAEMRLPNVEGTHNILRFAFNHGAAPKVLHYVSTLSVYGGLMGLEMDTVQEDFDMERCLSFMTTGETGYMKSKWVAERLVWEAKSRGLQVSIYRPGFIEAHSVTGKSNVDDLMCRFLAGCIQMRLYPDVPHKYWLPIPVDYAADAIAHISQKGPPGGVYNLVPDREREFNNEQMFEWLNAHVTSEYPLEKVSIRSWLKALSSIPSSNRLYPFTSYLAEKVHMNRYTPIELKLPQFLDANCRAALVGSGIHPPAFDGVVLSGYIDELKKSYSVL